MNLRYAVISCEHELYPEVRALRERVLRAPFGQTLSEDDVKNDALATQLVVFHENTLVGCVLLVPYHEPGTGRVSQVAVDEHMRGKGIGAAMLREMERIAREQDYRRLMMYARVAAMSLYERLGYTAYGDEYIRHDVVPCRNMEKTL